MDILLPTVLALCIPVLLLWAADLALTVREKFLLYQEDKDVVEYDGPPIVRRG